MYRALPNENSKRKKRKITNPPRSCVCDSNCQSQLSKESKRAIFVLFRPYIMSRFTNSWCNVLPNEAGLLSTMTPAASRAAIFVSAPPLPPLTMAPVVIR